MGYADLSDSQSYLNWLEQEKADAWTALERTFVHVQSDN
jgi:hypothetical protein